MPGLPTNRVYKKKSQMVAVSGSNGGVAVVKTNRADLLAGLSVVQKRITAARPLTEAIELSTGALGREAQNQMEACARELAENVRLMQALRRLLQEETEEGAANNGHRKKASVTGVQGAKSKKRPRK